jgi:hypothetical protein
MALCNVGNIRSRMGTALKLSFCNRPLPTETAAIGYTGDTIINSVADIICCSIGFLIAYKLGGKKTLLLFLAVEITMIIWIKDSLMINVLMLIYPFESIKT